MRAGYLLLRYGLGWAVRGRGAFDLRHGLLRRWHVQRRGLQWLSPGLWGLPSSRGMRAFGVHGGRLFRSGEVFRSLCERNLHGRYAVLYRFASGLECKLYDFWAYDLWSRSLCDGGLRFRSKLLHHGLDAGLCGFGRYDVYDGLRLSAFGVRGRR